jgi:hypothetical protein
MAPLSLSVFSSLQFVEMPDSMAITQRERVRIALSGTQIEHAGVETGFSDVAHLARTAAAVFGITPTKGRLRLRRMKTLTASCVLC